MPLNMKHGETKVGISLDLTAYLESIGLTISDKTDSIFMLKSDPTAADIDAEYQTGEGASLSYTGNTLTALIDDFSGIVVDVEYHIGIGIKFTGDTVFRELPLGGCSKLITFTQDVIRA